jgi:hypothetical protein
VKRLHRDKLKLQEQLKRVTFAAQQPQQPVVAATASK